MRGVPFFTDEFDEVGVQHESLGHLDRPRFSVSLGIIDRDFDFEDPIIDPTEFIGHFGRIGQWCSLDIEPDYVPKAAHLANHSVALSLSYVLSVRSRFALRLRRRD